MNILHRVRGERVAEAIGTMRACATATEKYMCTTYDVPELGRVVFLFRRFHHKHGKSAYWFWTAENAILEEDLRWFDRARGDPIKSVAR